MLAYTREKLLVHLQETSGFTRLYQQQDPLFAERVLDWMEAVEQTLLQLRRPAASLVSAQRGRVLAAADGYRMPGLENEKLSARKAKRIVTALALEDVQAELRAIISDIDAKFDTWREKIVQLLAVATTQVPVPLPPTAPREAWLAGIWQSMNINGDTRNMYNYLNLAMAPADRFYLLDAILANLEKNALPA